MEKPGDKILRRVTGDGVKLMAGKEN